VAIQTAENATIQQQPEHDLVSALSQQSQDIGPWSCFEGGDMVIRILGDYPRDAARHGSNIPVHELPSGCPLIAMCQDMLRPVVRQTGAAKHGCDNKIYYLVEFR
jgi:hypothetical protein